MKEQRLSCECRRECGWIVECEQVFDWSNATLMAAYERALHEAMCHRGTPLKLRGELVQRFWEHRHIARRMITMQLEYLSGSTDVAPHCVWRFNAHDVPRAVIKPDSGHSNVWDDAARIAAQHIREELRILSRWGDW